MDRGGMTRSRGYLWLAAVLSVALLIVVFIGLRPSGAQVAEARPAEADSLQPAAASVPARHDAPAPGQRSFAASARYAAAQVEPVSPPEHIFRKEKRVVVELNSADSLDLVQLYSIGPTFARRILKYRSLLGGYVDKEQLWEVYGMDSVRYNTIAPYVTVDPEGVAPLDLNTVSLDQLKHHPYLDYYQAKAIVLLRERVGRFESVQDLQKVPIIDNETYTKIIPYLTCNLQQNR